MSLTESTVGTWGGTFDSLWQSWLFGISGLYSLFHLQSWSLEHRPPQEGGTASLSCSFNREPPKARGPRGVYVKQRALVWDKKAIRTIDESGPNDPLCQNDPWGQLNINFSVPPSGARMQAYLSLTVSPDDSCVHRKCENYASAVALSPGSQENQCVKCHCAHPLSGILRWVCLQWGSGIEGFKRFLDGSDIQPGLRNTIIKKSC